MIVGPRVVPLRWGNGLYLITCVVAAYKEMTIRGGRPVALGGPRLQARLPRAEIGDWPASRRALACRVPTVQGSTNDQYE